MRNKDCTRTSANRQVLDNLEAYVRDKLSITRSLHDRLGLTENSLLGAQTVTVAMVQSNQLTTRIPNHSSNNNNIEIGQQNDNEYLDDREEHLYQVDGTKDVNTPTDHPQMMKIQSQTIIHIKDREKYMCQQTQIEKN